ncbi:MAG: dephospho-CoA kinase [Clostridia bacterium]|nr:dephospho-CoA kinase [Clostridia bacterium]
MKIIGLCGGSGSGKGIVSKIFLELGIPSIDTDLVYREMTNTPGPCLNALVAEFGGSILTNDGCLDRKRLADLVFAENDSKTKLKKLNEITHFFILNETRSRLAKFEQDGKIAAIVDAPVLFESGFDKECDEVICVITDRETRIDRIVSRDSISRDAAERRINSQMSDKELISRSDYVITNNGDISSLRPQIFEIAKQIKK